jgi:hypothetical protein
MVDVRFHDENQVVDFAAARVAAELSKAVGVPAAERPPSNPTRKDDLVPDQVISNSEILRQGAEAMVRLSGNRSRDWADWLKVLAALGIGRHAAMLEGDANEPSGYKYCKAFAKWLRCHEVFQAIDQADRKRMFDCLDNLSAIEEWRAGLSPAQLSKWNYPPTVLREWKKSQRPALPKPPGDAPPAAPEPPAPLLTPKELCRQLEMLGLDRFYREVMPDVWCAPLAKKALSLASPDALIDTFAQKRSPLSQPERNALRILRKCLPRPTE